MNETKRYIMKSSDIINQRLRNQGLVNSIWKSPQEVVKALGAIQSQDYKGAKWAIGLRLPNSTDIDIEKAMTDGKIIRTHVLRPTWHFVAPEDIRWMLKLTAPRVKKTLASYYHKLNLNESTLQKAQQVLQKSMKGKQLIRSELRAALEKEGINIKDLRFGFILAHAELDGLICSAGRRGKQHTYVLLDERVPITKAVTPKNPLLELVTRYFTTHGPATVQDFTWWAWVKTADVKKALQDSNLKSAEIDGKTYWFSHIHVEKQRESMHLLPNYDEYISYKDRSHYFEQAISKNSLINHFIIQNGKMIGAWKHPAGKDVKMSLFKSLSSSENQALSYQLKRYIDFRGQVINFTTSSVPEVHL